MILAKRLFLIIVVLIFSIANHAFAQNNHWPQFRGPLGNGHSNATNVPTKWSDDSKNVGWKTDIPGLGWSSPCVIGNEIWLTTAVEEGATLHAICIDLQSGKLQKNVKVFDLEEFGRIHGKNSHASPSVFIDGDLIFVHFGDYGTACLDRTNGKVLWKKEFKVGHFHGPGGSPLIHENLLILNRDGAEKQYLIALNKKTGEQVWKTDRKHVNEDRFTGKKMKAIAYSTPTIYQSDSGIQVIAAGPDHVAGYDINDGKEIWWAAYDGYSVVPRPTIGNGMVFYCSCYNRSVLYALKLGGKGDVTESHLAWKSSKSAPYNPTPILVGKELYAVSDNGVLQCFDSESGKVHWKERIGGNFSASPILVENRLYFLDEKGKTIIVEPGKEFKLIAENQIKGRTLASLTPLDGLVLLRTDKQLWRINK